VVSEPVETPGTPLVFFRELGYNIGMEKRMLPIGIDLFETMVTENYWYADKSLLIKDLLDKKALVRLITRPRRFGKTLNMSMLKYFFDIDLDSRHLFERLAIARTDGGKYLERLNSNPVLSITLKDAKGMSFEEALSGAYEQIENEVARHDYLLDSEKVDRIKRRKLQVIYDGKGVQTDYNKSFKTLSEALEQHHGKKTIILIDEYDVPLADAWTNDPPYYNEMVKFIASFMSSALKSNNSLEFAVVTGCLRVSKESIFTGLNNLDVNTMLDNAFSEYFGITEPEMDALIAEYGLEPYREGIRQWYNGYIFGNTNVHNPWSAINYVNKAANDRQFEFQPFWANTSGNSIVRTLIDKAGEQEREDLETLMRGGVIEKALHPEVTYDELSDSPKNSVNNIWNILFYTGYLKKADTKRYQAGEKVRLTIPNDEVRYIYITSIRDWFCAKYDDAEHSAFTQALLQCNTDDMTRELNLALLESISYMDSAENFYHGFMVGMLYCMTNDHYLVKSNREAGNGRSDIFVYSGIDARFAAVIELKTAETKDALEDACDKALAQIDEKNYAAELRSLRFAMGEIHKFGIAFCGKECAVKAAAVKTAD
jgi:hypothetical protein